MNENRRSLQKLIVISLCAWIFLQSQHTVPKAFATIDIHTISSVASKSAEIKNKYISEETSSLIGNITKGAGDIGGSVLGAATKIVRSLADQATAKVGSYIVDNAVGKLLKQYDKLSVDQKKTIRQYVCK